MFTREEADEILNALGVSDFECQCHAPTARAIARKLGKLHPGILETHYHYFLEGGENDDSSSGISENSDGSPRSK